LDELLPERDVMETDDERLAGGGDLGVG